MQKPASSSAIQVENVDQAFRVGFWMKRVQILFDINLIVPERSIFGFIGANGAGKTTLIHLLIGLRKAARGQIQILGEDSRSVQARMRIGYLPERPYFHEHLTGAELLSYFGALAGMSTSQIRSRIPKVLATVGMTAAKDLQLKVYSKGMLQRIGIAQALLHDPDVLILDEPMSGLDPLGRKEIREVIVELASAGKTVFFSTHVIPDVEAICDQIALIRKGRLIGCGPIGNFLASGPVRMEVGMSHLDSSIDPTLWKEFELIRKIPEGFRGIVQGNEQAEKVILRIFESRGRLLWANPIRPSLEDLFGE